MIIFENITTENFESVTFNIEAGSICKIIAGSNYEKKALLDVMLGMKKPSGGRVFLSGKDLYSISESESYKIFKKTGMVWHDGMLISNLKIWENIILPVWYHNGKRPEDVETRVMEIFRALGIDDKKLSEYMGKLPGYVPAREKRLIGFARAVLMEPDLMIYDALFEEMDQATAERLREFTIAFHAQKPAQNHKRTSVYVSANEQSLKDIKADTVLIQEGKGFRLWQ
jgi:phospholipid/cholesterol/gamma-HCH transport system ATP-binding protein